MDVAFQINLYHTVDGEWQIYGWNGGVLEWGKTEGEKS